MTSSSEQQSHSAPYLGDHRDYWWNPDFLQLMAKRWNLDKVNSLLDVGCGLGHWGQALSRYLPKNAKIEGLDREEEWVTKAQERTRSDKKFHYQRGDAEHLPFADNIFDMVTCQTLLLHVYDVPKVLKEMIRVLKPGGLLAVAEPNNTITEIVFDTVSYKEPVQDTVRAFQFGLICERGQQKLGMGFSSIGDMLPGYYEQLDLENIQVYLSDKTSPLFPPYADEEQQTFIKLLEEWYDAELLVWDKPESKKYYLAGGGLDTDFEREWKFLKQRMHKRIESIKQGKYSTSGGCLLYLISGRKPA